MSEEKKLRHEMLDAARYLVESGLNRWSSGNVSARFKDKFLVTPSAMKVEEMTPGDMVLMDFEGEMPEGKSPSSEWRFHRDILHSRPETGAVVHTHSMYATALSCLRKDIPPFHYMIALSGASTIPCADYALFGTQELSDNVLDALQGRKACLMANHGVISLGRDIGEAVSLSQEVESLCQQYCLTLQMGGPRILSEGQMKEVMDRFAGYWK